MSKLFQTTSIAALAALLATAPIAGFAQETTPDDGAAPEVTAPDAPAAGETSGMDAPVDDGTAMDTDPASDGSGDMDAPAADGVPMDDVTVTDDAPMTEPDVVAEEPAKPVEGQIVLQSEDTILAKNLMGSTVYTTVGDETVGSISDLIINLDGTVEGVVIGVGGFLGIGKKLVAVQMNSLDVSSDEAGNARLTTGATKADLEAAEAFVTAKEQQDAAAAQQAPDATAGGEPAPAE